MAACDKLLNINQPIAAILYRVLGSLNRTNMWTIRYSKDGKNMQYFTSDVTGGVLNAIEDFCSKGFHLHWIETITKEHERF